MNKKEEETGKEGVFHSEIGQDTKFVGNITGSEDILINGEVNGDIDIRASVHVGGTGRIKGTIKAANVTVEGRVEGNIKAEDKIELMDNANITADMECKHLAVADGAFYEGKVHMEGMETLKTSFTG
jgi:cytoskeletal protein CcmA (bactofilin family)